MATARQKKLAQAIVKNASNPKPDSLGVLLANVGYSKTVSKAKPTEIIESEGVQEELSSLGFTEENAKAITAQILLGAESEDRDKLKAADMVFKVHGTYTPEQSKEVPSIINIFHNPNVLMATQLYETSLKALITNGTTQPIPQSEPSDAPKDAQ